MCVNFNWKHEISDLSDSRSTDDKPSKNEKQKKKKIKNANGPNICSRVDYLDFHIRQSFVLFT